MVEEKTIENSFCGVYCGGCPAFVSNRCHGCRSEDRNQPRTSKWKCKMRKCCIEKQISGCGECEDLYTKNSISCAKRRRLVRSYQDKYSIDLNENVLSYQTLGPKKWAKTQRQKYSCPKCGHLINPYSLECYECHETAERGDK